MITKKEVLEALKKDSGKNWYFRLENKPFKAFGTTHYPFKLEFEQAGNCDSGSMFEMSIGINKENYPYVLLRIAWLSTETVILTLQYLKQRGIKEGML